MISRQSLKRITPVRNTYYLFKYFFLQAQIIVGSFNELAQKRYGDDAPVPPPRLRHRVHGTLDRGSFLQVGEQISQDLQHLCRLVNCDIDSCQKVLDFGCGSGRVIRNFQQQFSACQFYGTDIDPALINWCQQNLPDIDWSINDYQPPLPFDDETFNLIYGISVFTHLDEDLQHAWLRELQRIAAHDALIILSVHGEYCTRLLEPPLRDEIHAQGFRYFVTGLRGKFKLDGLPDFYQSAYHTEEYIHQVWSRYFEIVRYVEQGINQHQDAVIMRKR